MPSSHKTRKRVVGSLNVPKDREWGSKYRGKWTPIDNVEESSAGDIDAINPAGN